MNLSSILVVVIVALVVLGGGYFLLGNSGTPAPTGEAMQHGATIDDTSMATDTMMNDSDVVVSGGELPLGNAEGDAMVEKGSYELYAPEKLAKANEGDVVLFFRATWCPTCKAEHDLVIDELSGTTFICARRCGK